MPTMPNMNIPGISKEAEHNHPEADECTTSCPKNEGYVNPEKKEEEKTT